MYPRTKKVTDFCFYKKNLIQSCHRRPVVWIKSSFLPSPKRMAGDPSGKFGSQAGGGPLLLQRGAHWLGASLESSSPGAVAVDGRWFRCMPCWNHGVLTWHLVQIFFFWGNMKMYIYTHYFYITIHAYKKCLRYRDQFKDHMLTTVNFVESLGGPEHAGTHGATDGATLGTTGWPTAAPFGWTSGLIFTWPVWPCRWGSQ